MKTKRNPSLFFVKLKKGGAIVLLIPVLALALCISMIMVSQQWATLLRDSVIETYAKTQLEKCTFLTTKYESPDISELADKLSEMAGSTSYWFIYSEDKVILEKDKETTLELMGYNEKMLHTLFAKNGGMGIDAFFTSLEAGNDFTTVLSKDNMKGTESIAVSFILVDGKEYALGYSVTTSYILSTSSVNQYTQQYSMTIWLLSAALVIVTFGGSFLYLRKTLRVQDLAEELKSKNLRIDELLELADNMSIVSQKDLETGLFNRSFIDVVAEKIAKSRGEQKPALSLILLKQPEFESMCYAGLISDRLVAERSAAAISSAAGDNSICARLSRDTYCALIKQSDSKDVMKMLILQYKEAVPWVPALFSCVDYKGSISLTLSDAFDKLPNNERERKEKRES